MVFQRTLEFIKKESHDATSAEIQIPWTTPLSRRFFPPMQRSPWRLWHGVSGCTTRWPAASASACIFIGPIGPGRQWIDGPERGGRRRRPAGGEIFPFLVRPAWPSMMQSWPVNAATADGTRTKLRFPVHPTFGIFMPVPRRKTSGEDLWCTQAVRCLFHLLWDKMPSYKFRDIIPRFFIAPSLLVYSVPLQGLKIGIYRHRCCSYGDRIMHGFFRGQGDRDSLFVHANRVDCKGISSCLSFSNKLVILERRYTPAIF